jgi:tRNA threonylcarbamoyladenosine biosynthesis protein TsaE
MLSLRRTAPDRAAFATIAEEFAHTLRAGDVVALEGELGAGKTTFVAEVARELGSTGDVASPTFTFWHRYPGPIPLEHLDLYRIDDPAEARELGLEDALAPDGIAFVEWPERLPGFVPASAVRVRITGVGEGPRTLEIERPA